MATVTLPENLILKTAAAFDNYTEALALAGEIFTCAIVAIARHGNGECYLRSPQSKDSNIFAWAVLTL